MKWLAAVIAASSAMVGFVTTAEALPRRVVVAGPADDALTARVQKEINALGFETLRASTGADACAFQAIASHVDVTSAAAATCTDGEQVSIWIVERSGLRLREVVTLNAADEHANDIAAVRTGEITRASLSLREAEEEAAKPPPPAPPPPPFVPAPIEPDRPVKPAVARVPVVAASAGMSSLMGLDASAGTFSTQVEAGVSRYFAVAARLEYPIESHAINHSFGQTKIRPALVGAGIDLPLLPSSAFVIPRVGASLGVVWLRAESNGGRSGDDSLVAPAMYASAGVSLRIYGPMRLLADGVFGTTASRIVVRSPDRNLAYWGQPFGALSVRAEIMIR